MEGPTVRAVGHEASLRRVRATLAALQCGEAELVTGDVEVGNEAADGVSRRWLVEDRLVLVTTRARERNPFV